MANHKSAEKRARQALQRRNRNRRVQSEMRGTVVALRAAIAAGDKAQAQAALKTVESRIRRAASKGVLKKLTASRQISRLSRAVHATGN